VADSLCGEVTGLVKRLMFREKCGKFLVDSDQALYSKTSSTNQVIGKVACQLLQDEKTQFSCENAH